MPWTNASRCELIADQLRAIPVQVLLMPDRAARRWVSRPVIETGPSLLVELNPVPLSLAQLVTKCVFDLVIAGAGVILLLPLFGPLLLRSN